MSNIARASPISIINLLLLNKLIMVITYAIERMITSVLTIFIMKSYVFLYSDKINVPYLIGLFKIGKH